MNANAIGFPLSAHRSAPIVRPSTALSAGKLSHRYRCRPALLIVRIDHERGRLRVRPRRLQAVLAVAGTANQVGGAGRAKATLLAAGDRRGRPGVVRIVTLGSVSGANMGCDIRGIDRNDVVLVVARGKRLGVVVCPADVRGRVRRGRSRPGAVGAARVCPSEINRRRAA